MLFKSRRPKAVDAQADILSKRLQSQGDRIQREQKRRNISIALFFLINAASLVVPVYSESGIGISVASGALGIVGLVLAFACIKTQSKRLINIGTLVYIYVTSVFVMLVHFSGLFGIVGIIIGILWVFTFMDVAYAATLNYTLLVTRFVIFTGFFPWADLSYLDSQVRFLYLATTLCVSLTGHWVAFKLKQLTTFRDESFNLALEYCDELQKASEAKSAFLSSMSHDIRTPMNAISGYASIARRHLDEPERVSECLDKIETAERQLGDIVDDVLDMARLENGQERLHLEPLSLDALHEEVFDVIYPLAHQKNIQIVESARSIRHDTVLADPAKLRRIMLNLYGNAVKYTGENGSIHCKREELEGAKAGCGCYRFTIRDTGIGMKPEDLDHIYEPFWRAANASASAGTGLGIPIVKRYVELMDGTIAIESTLGVGTTVTVTVELPWDGSNHEDLTPTTCDNALQGMKVLSVDDSAVNREIATVMLASLGAEVVSAENGQRALEILQSSQDGEFDCVLMDIRMPQMNGMEAAHAIRSSNRPYLQAVPIYAVTANAFTSEELEDISEEMTGFISKPFSIEDLAATLRRSQKQ